MTKFKIIQIDLHWQLSKLYFVEKMEKIKLQKVFAHFCHCYCYCLLPTFKMLTFSNFQRKVSLIWTKIIARNYLETKRWEWKNFCKLELRQSSSWQALPMDGGDFFLLQSSIVWSSTIRITWNKINSCLNMAKWSG